MWFRGPLAAAVIGAIACSAVASGAPQTSQTALCDAVAARVRASADEAAAARTVWTVLTKTPAPLLEIPDVSELALERNPEPEVRWQFEKRARSLYGNSQPVTKDLADWDDFEIFAIPGSAVRLVRRARGADACEWRYFFRVTTAREVVRVPNPSGTAAGAVTGVTCADDGSWGYLGRVNVGAGTVAFLEYRSAAGEESLRIVPLSNAEWQPACTVSAEFETVADGRGRLRSVVVNGSR